MKTIKRRARKINQRNCISSFSANVPSLYQRFSCNCGGYKIGTLVRNELVTFWGKLQE